MLRLTDKNVNKKMYKDYLKYLLEEYYDINDNVIDNNSFLNFACFYPLPNSLENNFYEDDDKIIKNNNTYEFVGEPNNRILFANRLLPNPRSDPIPFTFPIKTNINTTELINTNCFYYEITVNEKIRENWIGETLTIGYGSIKTPFRCNPGWLLDTIGYNLIDGSLQCNQIIFKDYGVKYNIGDTFGAILIYISQDNYKVLFTFNGSLIINDKFNSNIIIKSQITPIIGYNHSCKIKVNFGNEMFKFDIKKFSNSNFVISQNNRFINNHNFINKINTIKIIENKIKNKENIDKPHLFAINDINQIFSPTFSFSENLILNILI